MMDEWIQSTGGELAEQLAEENHSTRNETCTNCTLSTTNSTYLHNQKPMNVVLDYDMT